MPNPAIISHRRSQLGYARWLLQQLLLHYYRRRGQRFLDTGLPQIAIFAFDDIGNRVNLFGRYDREELDMLLVWLKRENIGGTCIDIGANIGNHSVFFADHFGEVLSLEPHPMLFKLLCVNASLKDNIRCFNFGASSTAQNLHFDFMTRTNLGAARIVPDREPHRNRQTVVPVKPLDSDPDISAKTISFMKIDVEGHELEVLKGARQIIVRDKPAIAFEQLSGKIADGTSPCIEYLRNLGYEEFYSFARLPDFRSPLANIPARLICGTRMELRNSIR
jgi:FkbM family methyltransferase